MAGQREIERHLAPRLLRALEQAPVVILTGARQCGKSTLARALARGPWPATYRTLDDRTTLAAARHDPEGFLEGLRLPVVLDEVQRAPGLFLAIKAMVDRDRRPGRVLLTGSANPLFLPAAADALVGRVRHLRLWPLTRGELCGQAPWLIDALCSGQAPPQRPCWRCGFECPAGGECSVCGEEVRAEGFFEDLVRGGLPEPVLERLAGADLSDWFESYLDTILHRTVRDLSEVGRLEDLARLMATVAARSGGISNLAELSRSLGIPQTSLKRYIVLLEEIFLVVRLPAWSAHIGKRQVKKPKLFLTDTGLMAHLLRVDFARLVADRNLLGPLLETFVVGELMRQASFSSLRPKLYHYRTHAGAEVDVVLESRAGDVVGVEVKAAAGVDAKDLRGLRALEASLGDRFAAGVVLYTGSETVPFGARLFAVPISGLWAASPASIGGP